MIRYIYYLLGWDHSTTTDNIDIMCVNSFAITKRRFNYVVEIFPTDDNWYIYFYLTNSTNDIYIIYLTNK